MKMKRIKKARVAVAGIIMMCAGISGGIGVSLLRDAFLRSGGIPAAIGGMAVMMGSLLFFQKGIDMLKEVAKEMAKKDE